VLDLEVGTKGRFAVERRDAYGNRAPSRQGQLQLRCAVDGPGNAETHVVDGADGRSDVVASAEAAGRYFLTVVGGDDQTPVPGSPFELVCYPGSAHANKSVTSVYGASLASPDSDVLTAVAGDEITITVAPRDFFGNQTVFGPGARVVVTAVGGPGGGETKFTDKGGPRAEATTAGVLNAAGSYLLSAFVAVRAFPTQHVPPSRLPILVPEGTITLTVYSYTLRETDTFLFTIRTNPSPGTRVFCKSSPEVPTRGGAFCSAKRSGAWIAGNRVP
jgi:hypothetical protein